MLGMLLPAQGRARTGSLIAIRQLADQHRQRPAIHQHMMVGQHQPVRVVAGVRVPGVLVIFTQQLQADQRTCFQIERASQIFV